MASLKEMHGLIGYSGHERGINVSLAAIALGACVIERHFTLDKEMEGPDHAASLLAPGGILVYAVCALQPEEGAERIEALLKRNDSLGRAPIKAAELPGLEAAVTAWGDVATLPSMWQDSGHLDGFYIARLRKRG